MAPGMQQVEEWKRQVRMIGSGIHQMLVGYLGEEEKDMNKRGEAVINDSPDIVKNVYRWQDIFVLECFLFLIWQLFTSWMRCALYLHPPPRTTRRNRWS